MKKSFTAGLVLLLPIALTIWVISYLLDLFTSPLFHVAEQAFLWYENKVGIPILHSQGVVRVISRLIALVLTFVLIFFLGFIGRRFFFDSLIKMMNELIFRIPIVGAIYRLTKDITKAMLTSDKKTFKESVLIPFPSKESYALGLVTGEVPDIIQNILPHINTTVFVPTAPHPISGYLLFCSKESTQAVSISVEDTFKFLISCGVVSPMESSL